MKSLGVLVVLLLSSGCVAAAGTTSEISLHNTAIEKMLMEELFIDRGRYNLVPETACQYAYLESPSVAMSQGRVRIGVTLTGKLALEVSGKCVGGTSDVVQLTVSGKPAYAGQKIGLTDIRVDEVSNEAYRMLLQQFMQSAIPRAVQIDVREGLQRILAHRQSRVEVSIENLTVTDLTAENNLLHATLSFGLTAR